MAFPGLNDFQGKALLAAVRQGDFAHPGEAEAVALVLRQSGIVPRGAALDAGCGRGGTARLLREAGFAEVTGLEMDEASVDYARGAHPGIAFHVSDLRQADEQFQGRYEAAFLFNVLYAIHEQCAALATLHRYVRPGGRLCLFDYVAHDGAAIARVNPLSRTPSDVLTLRRDLAGAGWREVVVRDVSADYRRWYETLVARFAAPDLRARFPAPYVEAAVEKFSALLGCLERGEMGGAIITALG